MTGLDRKKTMSENIGTYPRYGTALCCSRPSFFPLFFFLFPYCRLFFPRGWLVRVSSVPVFPGSPGAGMGTGPSQYALLLIRCFFQKAWEREGERERMKWREGLTATERQNERRERNGKSRGGNAGAAGLPEDSRTGPEENRVVKKLRGSKPRTRRKQKE